MRSFNAKKATKKDLQAQLAYLKKARINGKNINKETAKEEYQIMAAMRRLKNKGLAEYSTIDSAAADLLQIEPLTSNAMILLSARGVTVDFTLSGDINLKSYATDIEIISNPNIQDDDYKAMKAEQVKATDKFPDTKGSFYKLGSKQRQFKQSHDSQLALMLPERAIQKLAADLSSTT